MLSLKEFRITLYIRGALLVACVIVACYQKEPEVVTETQVVYKTIEAEPEEPYFYVTSVERELLARMVWAEGRGEPLEAQKGIVSVVFNRAMSCNKTITEIIYAENNGIPQFSTASLLDHITPTEDQYRCVDEIIWDGPSMPSWVQYFRAGKHHNWSSQYVGYEVIGNTYFGGFEMGA